MQRAVGRTRRLVQQAFDSKEAKPSYFLFALVQKSAPRARLIGEFTHSGGVR